MAIIARRIAHIGNVAAVAVPVNIALVLAFGSVMWSRREHATERVRGRR